MKKLFFRILPYHFFINVVDVLFKSFSIYMMKSLLKNINLWIFIIIIILNLINFFHLDTYEPTESDYIKFHHKLKSLTKNIHDIQNTSVKTFDGYFLNVYYLRNIQTDKCFIYFYGRSNYLMMNFDMIKFLYNYCSVIIFEYRSHSSLDKIKCNLDGLELAINYIMRKDMEAIWSYTLKLGYSPHHISIVGESFNSTFAIDLVARLSMNFDNENYPHSLILISPCHSIISAKTYFLRKYYLGFLSYLFIPFIEDNTPEQCQYLNCQTKILIAHSPFDEIIPYQQGFKLYEEINKYHPSTYLVTITGTHYQIGLNDSFVYSLSSLMNDDK
jgi:hypothetical protein